MYKCWTVTQVSDKNMKLSLKSLVAALLLVILFNFGTILIFPKQKPIACCKSILKEVHDNWKKGAVAGKEFSLLLLSEFISIFHKKYFLFFSVALPEE